MSYVSQPLSLSPIALSSRPIKCVVFAFIYSHQFQEQKIKKPKIGGQKVKPNAACPCGNGKKYKKCCGAGGASVVESKSIPTPAVPSKAKAKEEEFEDVD
jgi:hypothetical protein